MFLAEELSVAGSRPALACFWKLLNLSYLLNKVRAGVGDLGSAFWQVIHAVDEFRSQPLQPSDFDLFSFAITIYAFCPQNIILQIHYDICWLPA